MNDSISSNRRNNHNNNDNANNDSNDNDNALRVGPAIIRFE